MKVEYRFWVECETDDYATTIDELATLIEEYIDNAVFKDVSIHFGNITIQKLQSSISKVNRDE